MVVEIRSLAKVCLVIAAVFSIAGIFSHFYEVRSVGLLPVIDCPLRPYTLPFLGVGFFFAALGIALYLRVKKNE